MNLSMRFVYAVLVCLSLKCSVLGDEDNSVIRPEEKLVSPQINFYSFKIFGLYQKNVFFKNIKKISWKCVMTYLKFVKFYLLFVIIFIWFFVH